MRMMLGSRFRTFAGSGGSLFPDGPEPVELPSWLSEDDLAVYVEAFRRTGFRGGLNYYRNIDRNWELTAPWDGAQISQPALYITGEKDMVRSWSQRAEERLPRSVPNLAGVVVVPGAGHWVQQEAPEAVNAALLDFLGKHAPVQ
jgi:epoxide hydrolase A/B